MQARLFSYQKVWYHWQLYFLRPWRPSKNFFTIKRCRKIWLVLIFSSWVAVVNSKVRFFFGSSSGRRFIFKVHMFKYYIKVVSNLETFLICYIHEKLKDSYDGKKFKVFPFIVFKKKNLPTHCFSCNKWRKIYPKCLLFFMYLHTKWIIFVHFAHLFEPTPLLES